MRSHVEHTVPTMAHRLSSDWYEYDSFSRYIPAPRNKKIMHGKRRQEERSEATRSIHDVGLPDRISSISPLCSLANELG